ncbi:MAG: MarR family transcriptional regulator [Leptospira sp.]|nr:MarR family transcriptional regulator [Leptospira sp.]
MDSLLLGNQICFPLYSATNRLMRLYRPILKKIGLTYPQYLVMMVLWESDEQTVTSLGNRLYLDSGTLTPLLKRLERSGLIQRKRSEADERFLLVSLTKNGKLLKSKAQSVPTKILEISGVSLEEALPLKMVLEKLAPIVS